MVANKARKAVKSAKPSRVVLSESESDELKTIASHLSHEERLKLAMKAMTQGSGLVYTQAVKLFDVKRSTLHDHMSSKCVKFTKGRYPLLSAVEEKELVKMLRNVQSKGYVITPKVCRWAAFMYAKLCNYRLATLKNDRQLAGRKWFAAFVKRNHISVAAAESGRRRPSSMANKSDAKLVIEHKSKRRW